MTPNDSKPKYTIRQLAELGGVSRRTVRYYVQRGLLETPAGAGRGSHYTQQHLDTLIRIRRWQESGLPLEEIAARLSGRPIREPAPRVGAAHYSTWTRIAIDDGVELHLRDVRLDAEQVRALGKAIIGIIR